MDPQVPAPREVGSALAGDRGRSGYGEIGYTIAPDFDNNSSEGFDFQEHLRILLKHKTLIGATTVGAFALAFIWLLLQTPIYTATVRLQVENESKILEKGNISNDAGLDFDYIRTQIELLQSRNMAERVAAIANLSAPQGSSDGSSLPTPLGGRGKGPSPTQAATKADVGVGIVLGGRSVKQVVGTRLIDISFSDPSPARAEAVANAFGDAFISFNLDKRLEANTYAKTFLDEQIQQLKIRLQDAEKAMIDFAQKEQLVSTESKDSKVGTDFEQVSAELHAATAERIKNELLWKQVQSASAMNLPQLLGNAAISQLRATRGTLAVEYKQKSSTYGPNYPEMLEVKSKIAEIDRQLAIEVKAIKESYKASYEASLTQEQELKKQLATTRDETIDTQKRSIQYNILKREVETTRSIYESLLQRFKEVDVASGVGSNNVFIVDRAQLPSFPSSPVWGKFLLLSLLSGLLASVGLAYLLERIDDVVHTSDEAERLSGLQALGIIPKVKNLNVEMADPRSGLSESYRSLCTSLQLSTADGLPRAMLVTSATPGEGKSLSSLLIAKQFCAMGLRVLLIDADLRNASLHKKAEVDNSVGLSNYLTSGCTPSEAIQRIGEKDQFFLMTSGPLPPNSAELLGSQRMQYLIDVTTRTFDIVIVDGPPVMGLADTPLLTRTVKTTIFAVAAGQTRRSALLSSLKRLALARAQVIGLILTKYNTKIAGYSYSYDYGGAGYGQIEYLQGAENREPQSKQRATTDAAGVNERIGATKPDKPLAGWLGTFSRLRNRLFG